MSDHAAALQHGDGRRRVHRQRRRPDRPAASVDAHERAAPPDGERDRREQRAPPTAQATQRAAPVAARPSPMRVATRRGAAPPRRAARRAGTSIGAETGAIAVGSSAAPASRRGRAADQRDLAAAADGEADAATPSRSLRARPDRDDRRRRCIARRGDAAPSSVRPRRSVTATARPRRLRAAARRTGPRGAGRQQLAVLAGALAWPERRRRGTAATRRSCPCAAARVRERERDAGGEHQQAEHEARERAAIERAPRARPRRHRLAGVAAQQRSGHRSCGAPRPPPSSRGSCSPSAPLYRRHMPGRRDAAEAPELRQFRAVRSEIKAPGAAIGSLAYASSRRPHHRRGPRRPARRARGRRRRGVGRDHQQGPSRPLPLGRRRGRHQRGPQPRGLVGVARVRHRQGLRLPRRPGRDRDHVPRGARRDPLARARRRHLPPQRHRPPRHARVRRRLAGAHVLRRRHHRPGDPARALRAADEAPRAHRPLRGVVHDHAAAGRERRAASAASRATSAPARWRSSTPRA